MNEGVRRFTSIAVLGTVCCLGSACGTRNMMPPNAGGAATEKPQTMEKSMKLFKWARGMGVRMPDNEKRVMYLWFYEWHMFDAVSPGQHTHAAPLKNCEVDEEGANGRHWSDSIELKATACPDGADLVLKITNESKHDWPELAAIIPCFNPGHPKKKDDSELNENMVNENTWYLSAKGLAKHVKRTIYYNREFREGIDAQAKDGKFEWSGKWPATKSNAVVGIMIRESNDGKYVAGIAWEDFISAQGHNPWACMHLSIRVGPLKMGETKTIRGKIYLVAESKEDCLKRFRKDFGVKQEDAE